MTAGPIRLVRRVLAGEHGAHRDIVLLNAGAGLVVAGRAADLADGLTIADCLTGPPIGVCLTCSPKLGPGGMRVSDP